MSDEIFGYHDFERCCAQFVLEDETWPVFMAWAQVQHVSGAAHEWLKSASVIEMRRECLRHSSDPEVRALAELL